MTQAERRIYLIAALLKEQPQYANIEIPPTEREQKILLRSLFNIRMPLPISGVFLEVQDEYLQEEIRRKGITDYHDLTPIENKTYLWQGDITTLRCGAIVNAANSQMLGCFCPNHGCIDNAIHTYAGVQLRAVCADIMNCQGHEEKTGGAKITPAFNLPCDYILHTVGPIVSGKLTPRDEALLESCYTSCLRLAEENSIKSVAFCCISTGKFHFPNEKAAEIAVNATERYREQNQSEIEVIFNVFKDADYQIYRELFR